MRSLTKYAKPGRFFAASLLRMTSLGVLLAACGSAPAAAPASPASASPSAKPAASAAASAKPAASAAANPKPEKDHITLAYATASGEQTFLTLASDKGMFQKYGLTVNVTY